MKKKHQVVVDFSHGEAAEHVTGSCIYVESQVGKILLDCGAAQSNNIKKDYETNSRRYKFRKDLDLVIISHSHFDHIGNLPILFKQGYRPRVIVPSGNYHLIETMLKDGAYICAKEAIQLSIQLQKRVLPLYTITEVEMVMASIEEIDFDTKVELQEGVELMYTHAGHILGSAQTQLWLTYNNITKKIIYTGDLGNPLLPKHYTHCFAATDKADLFIGETTYADSNRLKATPKIRTTDLNKLHTIIEETCVVNKGKVLIPCFALDRVPELLTEIYIIFHNKNIDIPIILDSPLALKQLRNYFNIVKDERLKQLSEVVNWENVIQINDYKESSSWAQSPKSCVIIASSGMMNAGRVLYYAPYILNDSNSYIVFCGYSSENSLAWKIKNAKAKDIFTIGGKKIFIRSNVSNLNSFSSHMQYDELIDYYSTIQTNKIALVHGEMQSKIRFAAELSNKIRNNSRTTPVVAVNKGTKITI